MEETNGIKLHLDLRTRMINKSTKFQMESYHKNKTKMYNVNTNKMIDIEYGPKWFTVLMENVEQVNVGDILFHPYRGRLMVTSICDPDYGLVNVKIKSISQMEQFRRRSDLTVDIA